MSIKHNKTSKTKSSVNKEFSFSRKLISSTVFLLFILQTILIPAAAQSRIEVLSPQVSTTVVISEFRFRGPNGALDELIELYNLTGSAVNIGGWKLNGSSDKGKTGTRVTIAANTSIPAYGHFLMTNPGTSSSTGYSGSVAGNLLLDPNNGVSDTGGIAILNSSDVIIDQVGLSTGSAYKEGTPLASLTANTNQCYERKAGGNAGNAQDTDNNSNDFQLISPCNPQNLASPPTPPTGGTTSLSGTGAANPSSVAAGGTSILTVTVNSASDPTSSGITVTGDLSGIGGSATQMFFDDGTNGDDTAGDNIFSYVADVPANASSGSRTFSVTINDAQSRTASTSISLTVTGGTVDSQEHLLMGNPTNATTDVNMPFNYLLSKPQYAVSYHRDRAIPNWVSWHLDSTWLGSATRQNDFRPDPSLPYGWYQVTSSDYTGSGFTRGHHTPSGDRTRSNADNSATFLMTNMMPQAAGNNNGPWEKLESDSRALTGQGYELYIVTGGVGIGGVGTNGSANTIANGKVTVPAYTWKVILILPVGDNDVSRVNNNTRTIAVIMPNVDSITADGWEKYLATVDQVENLTGYDFFSNVPVNIQNVIESKLDAATQSTYPQTVSAGNYTNLDVTSTPNKILTGNITVTGNLNLGGTNLATSNFCVTLGPNATVTRTYGYVNGCVEKQFSSPPAKPVGILNNALAKNSVESNAPQAVFEYPVGTENGYSPVTANVTALGQSPSSLTVKPVQNTQPNVPDPNLALKRYWTLTENGNLTADLTFKYLDVDVPIGVNENNFTLQRYENGFMQIPATIDAAANTATTTGISQFSDWTLTAPSGATAAGVDVSGRVTSLSGRSIAGATISLTNSSGEIIMARTNPFGYYHLADIPSGTNYVVNVQHKSYRFTPQVINLNDNLDGLDFVGFSGN